MNDNNQSETQQPQNNQPQNDQPAKVEISTEGIHILNHVLPPKKYKLKTLLLFSDFFVVILYVYYYMIRSLIKDATDGDFSFASNRMFSFYCVLAITGTLFVLVFIFKMTKSAMTRFERENEVRQDPTIKVWLAGFDWGWPILFLPTVALILLSPHSTPPLSYSNSNPYCSACY
jgi:hypothetical protein